jgi:hypothetical protein
MSYENRLIIGMIACYGIDVKRLNRNNNSNFKNNNSNSDKVIKKN